MQPSILMQWRRKGVSWGSRDPVAQLVEQRTFNPYAPNTNDAKRRHGKAFDATRRHPETPEPDPKRDTPVSGWGHGVVRRGRAA